MDTRPILISPEQLPRQLHVAAPLAREAAHFDPRKPELDPVTLDLGPVSEAGSRTRERRTGAAGGVVGLLRSGLETVSRSWDGRRVTWNKLSAWAGALGHVRSTTARDAKNQQD